MFRLLLVPLLVAALVATPSARAEIRIGFANPLTGPFAATGARNRAVMEMAVEDLNRRGGLLGQKVSLITADDACGIEQAVAAACALIEARVGLVVGHGCSHSSLMAAGIYETAGVLMITPFSTHPRLTEEGRTNVFRLIGRDDRQGELAGNFLADHWAGKRIAILHDGSVYGEGLAARTRQQLRQRGIAEAMHATYEPGAKDYARLASRLRQAAIDVVYIGGYGPDAGLILRTVRERGYRPQLIGGDALGMDELWTVAGAAGEGTIFSYRPNPGARPEAAALLVRLRARAFGPRATGLGAYAAVQVLAQAIERAGTADPDAVARVLHRGRFATVLGRVAFDAKGDREGAAWQWQVWTHGTFVPINGYLAARREALAATGR